MSYFPLRFALNDNNFIILSKAQSEKSLFGFEILFYRFICNFGKQNYRVKHRENEFAKRHKHINGIENFFASLHSQLQEEGARRVREKCGYGAENICVFISRFCSFARRFAKTLG
ncbi:hypothetical protein [Campylobacter troglodytis]|uniref:hypothetical protein n=1 Tax=Campylobacter troglodytis TaxID=654363 RepID=UPI003D074C2A